MIRENIGYSQEHIKRAKEELLKQFDLLCCQEYGKLTLNANRQSKSLEIVLETHYRIKEIRAGSPTNEVRGMKVRS